MKRKRRESANHTQTSTQTNFYNLHNPLYLKYGKNINYSRYLVGRLLPDLINRKNKILEVGAGQGRFTFELVKHSQMVTATDIAEKEISLLKTQAQILKAKNISVKVLDVLKVDRKLAEIKYDCIVGFFMLHHLPNNMVLVVNNLKKYLKTGGRLIFIEPNNIYPFHVIQWMIEKEMSWKIEKGIYSNFIGNFKRACSLKGFKMIKSKKFGFLPPPLINLWPSLTLFDKLIERIPLVKQIFCPYILLSADLEIS